MEAGKARRSEKMVARKGRVKSLLFVHQHYTDYREQTSMDETVDESPSKTGKGREEDYLLSH
jgi:hypothetical protein